MFHKIVLGLLIAILVLTYMTMNGVNSASQKVTERLQCHEIVDDIYTKCSQGEETQISDIKGHNTTLKYENGVCIIK